MVAIRPVYPIFEQNRKELGSLMGHANEELPSFRELNFPENGTKEEKKVAFFKNRPRKARCARELKQCDEAFDYKSALHFGFGNRPLAQRWEGNKT
jgi:hypothetical protein